MEKRLRLPPRGIHEIIDVIHDTPSGSSWLARFLPWRDSGRIRLEVFPRDVLLKLRAVRAPGEPNGAAFVTDGEAGCIYVDLELELGALAPFLIHEIVHSLDDTLWRAARLAGESEARRRKVLLDAECRAYEAQQQFLDELVGRQPGLREFLRARYPQVRVLNDPLSREEIAELYGLRSAA
jgi:hypothetical protein